jgi:hypothetical protein
MTANRIAHRTGVVHIVVRASAVVADTARGQGFALGRGRLRIWQLARGGHYKILYHLPTRWCGDFYDLTLSRQHQAAYEVRFGFICRRLPEPEGVSPWPRKSDMVPL